MAAANIYDTNGAVVGILTAGADQAHISGVIDQATYGGALAGKALVIQHQNGNYYMVIIDVVAPAVDAARVIITGHAEAQAVNFVPKPFLTMRSAANAVSNMLAQGTAPQAGFPIWPIVAGGAVVLLLLKD